VKRLAVLLATLVLLVGCGSDGSGDGGSRPGGTTTETSQDDGYGY
jgi:major membrane immunogen (membrane-anchored lipoprotein)